MDACASSPFSTLPIDKFTAGPIGPLSPCGPCIPCSPLSPLSPLGIDKFNI